MFNKKSKFDRQNVENRGRLLDEGVISQDCPYESFTLYDDDGNEEEQLVIDKFKLLGKEYWVTETKATYKTNEGVYFYEYTSMDGEPFLDPELTEKEEARVLKCYKNRCEKLLKKYGDTFN